MDSILRKRGRPKTHPVDHLRAKVWFAAVRRLSGLPSAYSLEMVLDADLIRKRPRDVARPRRWDAYQKGTKVPLDKPGSRNAIDQAEEKYPGSARWFRSPIWDCLRDKIFSYEQIDEALRSLEPAVVEILFEDILWGDEMHATQKSVNSQLIRELVTLGNFDSLVAIILLVRLSEAIASPALRDLALDGYHRLVRPTQSIPELKGLHEELFSLLAGICMHWFFVAPNRRGLGILLDEMHSVQTSNGIVKCWLYGESVEIN